MPLFERRPDTTNAERYHSWTQSSATILAFVADEQETSPAPMFVRQADPADPTVTAALFHIHYGWYQPVRDGDWIVEGDQGEHLVLRPAEFEQQWKPTSTLVVGVGG